jgi:hypothetical protein
VEVARRVNIFEKRFNHSFRKSKMHLHQLLIIVFLPNSLAILQLPYPNQTFQLPNHPSNWICTVHITVATFANDTSSDITERFLASNRDKIIPTLSKMVNRSISIVPVISFFEPCTISVLIDATVHGSSSVFKGHQLHNYIKGNEYAYRGWKHSLIIIIYFSCNAAYNTNSLFLPHRLFYHSLDCGYDNIFPNEVFVSDPLDKLWNIKDLAHNIHAPQLHLAIRRSISTPKYGWDSHDPNVKPNHCLASRWDELSQMLFCDFNQFAVQHFEVFLNFTAVAKTPVREPNYGKILTHTKFYLLQNAILWHAIDSTNRRVLYCDRNSDSPSLRPISLSSPFSFETWVTLVSVLIVCAIVSSFTLFDMRSIANKWAAIMFINTICNSLVEMIVSLLEKDIGRKNCTKTFIGLIVICLGNTYKNYLTIELVFPRAGDAISNFTELLDLNFSLLETVNFKDIDKDKSIWLKSVNYPLEIHETKREKYGPEVERWLKLIPYNEENILNELASVTSKNAWIKSGPDYIQVHALNLITQRKYPLSCHFVKRPFAHQFRELYFLNPIAEEFKRWTAKFLDHGFFVFWKRLQSHMLTLDQHRESLQISSKTPNSGSTEALDLQNFIGQVHLVAFYIVISVLTAICLSIFLLECAAKKSREVSLFILTKLKYFSLQLLWTVVRFLFLMCRLIGRLYESRNPL